MKYQVGDFCYHDFELVQVKRANDLGVQEVTTGYVSISSNFLECFPLTLKTKMLSDMIKEDSDAFHRDFPRLNFPDLRRKMTSIWQEMVEHQNDDEKLKQLNDKYQKFIRGVKDVYKESLKANVDGFDVFKV